MKLPNGFGSVYKLSGKNRRNPWIARKTVGWELDTENQKLRQIYETVGYYPTRKAALEALSLYNANPYNLEASRSTFRDIYESWSDWYFPKVGESSLKSYAVSWGLCAGIADKRFADVKLAHLQSIVDSSGKNFPTLKKFKSFLSHLYKYAIAHEVISKDRNLVEYVDISEAGNPDTRVHRPFTAAEVQKLWENADTDLYFTIILMLIYSGLRISELFALEKSNVRLRERVFDVVDSKTAAGIRTVPIAEKVYPFFKFWYDRSDTDYLVTSREGRPFNYSTYRDSYWNPLMHSLGMEHLPHDTRHTCVSLLAAAQVDSRIVRKIVGHSGSGVTENVYTHFEPGILLDAINRI